MDDRLIWEAVKEYVDNDETIVQRQGHEEAMFLRTEEVQAGTRIKMWRGVMSGRATSYIIRTRSCRVTRMTLSLTLSHLLSEGSMNLPA